MSRKTDPAKKARKAAARKEYAEAVQKLAGAIKVDTPPLATSTVEPVVRKRKGPNLMLAAAIAATLLR